LIEEDEIYENYHVLPLGRILSLSNSLSPRLDPSASPIQRSTDRQNPTFSEDVAAPLDIDGGEHPLDPR